MPDLVKEAVFNLLRGHCEDGPVLDLFAGTGTMGLEASSRGSPRVVFVEKDRRVVKVLERNIADLDAHDGCEVVIGDALGPAALTRCPRPVHLVFMDPPYEMVRDPQGWVRVRTQARRLVGLLDDTGYLVLRTPSPFFHTIDAAGSPPASGRTDHDPGHNTEHDGEEEVVEIDLSDPDGDDALDAFETGPAHGPGAEPIRVDVDLTIDGAVGPETHRYATTAVHLYMKRRG